MPIKFKDIREKIISALNEKGKMNILGITEEVTLIDGIVNQPIYDELTGSVIIGGPTIPMIMLIGNNTGRVYFFALKALVPSDIN